MKIERLRTARAVVAAALISLLTPLLLSAAGPGSQGGNGPMGGNGPVPGRPTPELQTFVQQMNEYRQNIEAILVSENATYRELAEKLDKTFEDLRAMAELRIELLKTSAAAQAVQAQMEAYRAQFASQHPNQLGPPEGARPRPQLTAEQTAAIEQYRQALTAKEQSLDELLKQASERYAELLSKEQKTREEIREMLELRRSLIAESEAAQQLVTEIQTLIREFREEHPFLARLGAPVQARQGVGLLKDDLQAVRAMERHIQELLADASEEYAALLAKEDRTAEEQAQMAALRLQLTEANPQIKKMVETRETMVNRIRNPRRPALPPVLRPGQGTRPAAGSEK